MDTREAIFLKDDKAHGVPKSEYDEHTEIVVERHINRYQHAAKALGGNVLDIACGSGYGADILTYNNYVGVDRDKETIDYAKRNHSNRHSVFICLDAIGGCKTITDGTLDGIACIETIEHLPKKQQPLLLDQFKRALDRSGALFLTAPVTQDGIQSGNPYHLYEPRLDEMLDMLHTRFDVVTMNLERIFTTAQVEQIMGEFICYP